MQKKQTKWADFSEFRASGEPGLQMRAFKDGVRMQGPAVRMLGWQQAKHMGEMIIKAAEEAKKRGAPSVLMG